METRILKTYSALWVAIFSVSFAAIFIRLTPVPALVIAALRMIFSSMLLLPWVVSRRDVRHEMRLLSHRDALLLFFSGLLLALHFALWITSLSFTGVTSSVVFVTTSPLFVALYVIFVFKERVSKVFWLGLIVAGCGGLVLGGGNLVHGEGRWKGDLLAVAGAIAVAGYFLVGSRLRKRLSLVGYVFPVYSFAAVILSIAVVLAGIPFHGYSWKGYLYCFLLAFFCQLIGHSLFNWALKYLKATMVSIAALGEPVGASILALLILGEVPHLTEVLGGIFILLGICIVLYVSPEAVSFEKGVGDSAR